MTGGAGDDDELPDHVLDRATVVRVVRRACELTGRPGVDVDPVRLGEDALVRLSDGVLARVGSPGAGSAARHEVAVSRLLAAAGVPAVRAAAGSCLVDVEGRPVTFWAPLPVHTPAPNVPIARALRRLHAVALPVDPPLPPVDPFRRVSPRLQRSGLLAPTERHELLARLEALRQAWTDLPPGLPAAVVHGDAWAGNVVQTGDGEVLLLDLGRAGVGPPEWDLIATALNRTTFGIMDGDEYRAFSRAYGHDVTAWQGFEVLRDLREIRVVAYALHAAQVDPSLTGQARARVHDLLAGVRPWPGWQPL